MSACYTVSLLSSPHRANLISGQKYCHARLGPSLDQRVCSSLLALSSSHPWTAGTWNRTHARNNKGGMRIHSNSRHDGDFGWESNETEAASKWVHQLKRRIHRAWITQAVVVTGQYINAIVPNSSKGKDQKASATPYFDRRCTSSTQTVM
jgi:hypothetical protein